MQDFLTLARELAQETRTVVGVFSDPAFEGHEVPRGLHAQHFVETWGARDDVRVVLLDAEAVRSYSILFKGRMDVLVYPYGELYPMDAPSFYSGQTLNAYLKRGGAVLTTGGVPFGLPVNADSHSSLNGGNSQTRFDLDPNRYEKWVAPLGVKYYLHPHIPPVTHADTRYLASLGDRQEIPGCPLGIVITNSAHEPEPKPPHGNVFPERYPARQVIPLLWGADHYGQTLAVNALLVQDFETGSRRVHFAHETEPHPLSPYAAHFPTLMNDLLALLVNRVMVQDVEAHYACYRQGEQVQLRAEVISHEQVDCEANVLLEIFSAEGAVHTLLETVSLQPHTPLVIERTWAPTRFGADEYTLRCTIQRDGRTVSSAENGFVVWNDDVVRRGPRVQVQGGYLHVDDTGFIIGTNYYESTRGEIMWYRPNVQRIASDIRQMQAYGINYIRPHYHHLKWFKDYLLFQHGRLFPFYQRLENVVSPLPDEQGWRIWDMFIYLCQKYGIVYGGDLFTLIPEEMGDPRGWFPLRESVYCEEKREVQRTFLRQITRRYLNVPGISWDLWNEPVVPLEALADWTADLRQVLTEIQQETNVTRLITVGGGTGEQLGELVDYVAPHSPARLMRGKRNTTGRPLFLQEMHLDQQEDLANEQQQAELLREGVFAALANGLCGVAPWSWCRQMRLWQDVYQHHYTFPMEKWDDRLGMHVHDDGTVKPAGQAFHDLAILLRTLPLSRFDADTGQLSTTRGEVKVTLVNVSQQQGHTLYHVAGERCFGAMARTSVSWMGRWTLSGPRGGYVTIFSQADDIATTPRLYIKSELPGLLTLSGRAARPQAVQLVESLATGDRVLDTLDSAGEGETVTVLIEPTQQAYWVRLDW